MENEQVTSSFVDDLMSWSRNLDALGGIVGCVYSHALNRKK